jgi:DNA-binding NtrC family response regulator
VTRCGKLACARCYAAQTCESTPDLSEAGKAHQALEQLTLHPEIAPVFSDIMLPGGMLGSQLEQRLRELRPEVRVLMTSGFSETGMLHRGILDGSVELLAKPYKLEELAHRIRARLDGKEENKRVQA